MKYNKIKQELSYQIGTKQKKKEDEEKKKKQKSHLEALGFFDIFYPLCLLPSL